MKLFFKYRNLILLFSVLCCGFVFISCDKKEQNTKETSAEPTQEVSQEITAVPDDGKEKEEDNVATTIEDNAYYENYTKTGVLASIKDVYKDKFHIGVALAKHDIENKIKANFVASQFSSITCENEMKADFTLDHAATLKKGDEEFPVVNMKNAVVALNFAKENDIKMRAHTLVWHSQTPRWLFTEGFDTSEDAPFVTREVMLARMENYIKQEMEYVNTNYEGVVYTWDVVNEAIEIGDGHKDGIRIKNNYWYEIIGDDYIEQAFTFARKYADKNQKLFYNDYGTYEKSKLFAICELVNKLKEKGIIDGVGLQDHIQIDYPTTLDYQYAINKYSELGLEIQITELDIACPEDTEEAQEKLATRYRTIFSILLNCLNKGNANITSVTVWGLSDDRSWINKPDQPSYPLLFDKNLKPKRAFFGALLDPSVKKY